MHREILFRAKSIEDDTKGQWKYGFYREFKTNKGINYFIDSCNDNESFFIDGATVGQYTGVNDKSGKKIFEGDRCQLIKGKRCICGDIKFKNGGFYFKENCGEAQMDLNGLEVLEKCIGYKVVHNGTIFDE